MSEFQSNFRVFYRPHTDARTPVHMEFDAPDNGDRVVVRLGAAEFIAFSILIHDVASKVAQRVEHSV